MSSFDEPLAGEFACLDPTTVREMLSDNLVWS